MNDFRRHMASQANVVLHVVELAYGDRPFEVTGNHADDIQFRTNAELWHKENLLNLGIARLPHDWKYAAYIDADLHFTRHDWALETIHQLQHYDWLQLFSSYSALSSEHRPHKLSPSFAYGFEKQRRGWKPPKHVSGSKYGSGWLGATGGAWAFTREALNATGGLLDVAILGSGDWHMSYGLAGEADPSLKQYRQDCPHYVRVIEQWQSHAAKLRQNFGYLENHAVHFWHGDYSKRFYGERPQILIRNGYDPLTDITRDWHGVLKLNGNKPALRQDIRMYFQSRVEDDPNLANPNGHLV